MVDAIYVRSYCTEMANNDKIVYYAELELGYELDVYGIFLSTVVLHKLENNLSSQMQCNINIF